MKHTSLPWRVVRHVKQHAHIGPDDYHTTAKIPAPGIEEGAANLDLILFAVNNHFKMLDAMRDMVAVVEGTPGRNPFQMVDEWKALIAESEKIIK